MSRRRLRRLFRLESVERNVEDELAFHFESVVEELMRTGRSREDAEREAHQRFGDEARYRRELGRIDRDIAQRRRWSERGDALWTTLRQALRDVRRTPGLALGIVLAFALGIGANATMFGIIDRLLLSPPPHIVEPDAVKRLVVDRHVSFMNGRMQTRTITFPDYEDLTRLESFSGVAAYTSARDMTIGRGPDAEPVQASLATASFWDVLGTRPSIGRFFGEDEDRVGAAGTVVLGYGYWQRRHGGSRDVLGTTIDFGYGPYTVVGVAPKGFTGVSLSPVDLWLPLVTTAVVMDGGEALESRGWYWLAAVARLAPGVTEQRATAEATAAHRSGREETIERGVYDDAVVMLTSPLIAARGPAASGLSGPIVSGSARSWGTEADVALWLAGVSAVVLLIAAVNVANLLLARAIRRRREMGIRMALGVSRRRLLGQTVIETTALALAGAAAAVLVSRWAGDLLRNILLPDIEWVEVWSWERTAAIAFGLAVLAGGIAAIAPAREVVRGDVARTLRASAAGIARSTSRTRAWLAIVQASLSVLLLVGAGLFLRSLERVASLDLGFRADDLYLVQPVVETPGLGQDAPAFFAAARDRIAQLAPTVRAVSFTRGLPMRSSYAYGLRAEGLDSIPPHEHGGPYGYLVGPDYLRTLGLEVARGRPFDDTDRRGSPPVLMINEAMAGHLWPGQDALGKCIYIGRAEDRPPCARIIGIVKDARRDAIQESPTPQYYALLDQEPIAQGRAADVVVVRMAPGAPLPAAGIRNALFGIEPRLRWVDTQPFQELIDPQIRSWKLGATLFTVFGALALVVAAIGLYSVLAFDVAQRTREIGLRTALGAARGRIIGEVVRRAVKLAAVGAAVGLIVAAALAPRVRSLLYETSPYDATTLAVVAAVMISVAALASGIPAWRAARVDPNTALRAE